MGKLVVMDYSDCSINVYDAASIDEENSNEVEDYIDKQGHNLNECYYMLGDDVRINRFDLNDKQYGKRQYKAKPKAWGKSLSGTLHLLWKGLWSGYAGKVKE